MAHATYTLRATKFGYVNEADAYIHYPVVDGQAYKIGGRDTTFDNRYFYVGFEEIPDNIKRCEFLGGQITMRCGEYHGSDITASGYWAATVYSAPSADFDAATITFENSPKEYFRLFSSFGFYHANSGDSYEVTSPRTDTISGYKSDALNVARTRAARFHLTTSKPFDDRWLELETTLQDNRKPCFTIHYDDSAIIASKVVFKYGYTNGSYADPRTQLRFAWDLVKSDYSAVCIAESFKQTSATFYWKVQGADNWNTVAISGDVKEYNAPANTFPVASTIVWKVQATDEDSTTTETAEYTFSTADTLISANLLNPVDSVEDGSSPIAFNWSLVNASGTQATRTILEYKYESEPDTAWRTLVDENEAVDSYIAPSNTFIAGTVQWRVAAYNIDNVIGAYSAASFICVAAPQSPSSLNSDNAPFTTFTWQSADQQAFRIVVDGVEVAKEFGTQKSYTLEDYLADGQHTVSVQVQGGYGLWSQASSLTFTVKNVQKYAVQLSGEFGIDAVLTMDANAANVHTNGWPIVESRRIRVSDGAIITGSNVYVSDYIPVNEGSTLWFSWTLGSSSYGHSWFDGNKDRISSFASSTSTRTITVPDGAAYIRVTGYIDDLATEYIKMTPPAGFSFESYIVYRDNKRIGRTNSGNYTDRFSIGEHSYYSIARASDGNYTKSNTVVGTTDSDTLQISDLYSPGWVELRLSANSNNVQTYTHSRVYTTRHINGAVYPLLELSPFEDETVKYNVAFKNGSDLRLIEQFRGKPVVTKYRGEMVVGVMTGLTKSVNDFYASYSFGVERIHWEDFVDDTNS